LPWPEPGVVRANLPLPWVAELVAAGAAAGNRAPDTLVVALGPRLRPALQAIVSATSSGPTIKTAAAALLVTLPALPNQHVRINVLGPLSVSRDDEPVSDGDVRRQRVRELLSFLVVRRRARREDITEELWPELDDRGHNLRVTLGYLQRVLQPDRARNDPPYFLRSHGLWLSLEGRDHLEVDSWALDDLLDEADRAERAGTPAVALAAYRAALPLWRGEPHADVPYSDWAQAERVRLRSRFTNAAVRGGELLLAAGMPGDARAAARRAIDSDVTAEPAYRLLARTHLAENNRAAARETIDACRAALAELELQPESTTLAVLS
jgi:DNA-binding SARP family transcriptional activator